MDNLGSHKVAGVRQAIEAAGAERRFLPPYSPDMDPIEQVFAKVKNTLRKLARRTANRGRPMERRRHGNRRLPTLRMPKLFPPRRIRIHLNGMRSSGPATLPFSSQRASVRPASSAAQWSLS